ncbi:MAG: NAD(P)-dependent oxidoreductase [Phycisphaeraceae bacterium]|nr:NAD(P)-dependent oxidoreductase [Phycisphaeraceae bacterium]
MRIALTGATGFLGRHIANLLLQDGHQLRCWYRPGSDRGGFHDEGAGIEWVPGALTDGGSVAALVSGVDAVVHAALSRQGAGFSGAEGDLLAFVQANISGSLDLMQRSVESGVGRFVFISTCAVHDRILDDRPLDEAHPLWPAGHYGAHKAAIEKFVHSFGLGTGWPICSLRPSGIYGISRPMEASKWYALLQRVIAGEPLRLDKGGKEVHAEDVARAVKLLLEAPADRITGEAFNCCDGYIADQDVAKLACGAAGIQPRFEALNRGPKNQIKTDKLKALGMRFGGGEILQRTITQLVEHLQRRRDA